MFIFGFFVWIYNQENANNFNFQQTTNKVLAKNKQQMVAIALWLK